MTDSITNWIRPENVSYFTLRIFSYDKISTESQPIYRKVKNNNKKGYRLP